MHTATRASHFGHLPDHCRLFLHLCNPSLSIPRSTLQFQRCIERKCRLKPKSLLLCFTLSFKLPALLRPAADGRKSSIASPDVPGSHGTSPNSLPSHLWQRCPSIWRGRWDDGRTLALESGCPLAIQIPPTIRAKNLGQTKHKHAIERFPKQPAQSGID
jgi:hypothetical protein